MRRANDGLPATIALGHVHLAVADLDPMVVFYRDTLGLQLAYEFSRSTVFLSASGRYPYQIALTAIPGASKPAGRSAGLYHLALLLPNRAGLAGLVRHLHEVGWPLDGAADHSVSEAVYLRDPEGNGVELYADRERDRWQHRNGELVITTEPLDMEALLAEGARGAWSGLPAGAQIGHVHLRVADLQRAETFYRGVLGFAVVVRTYPGALFLAAGGYHHHLGLNTWAGSHLQPLAPGTRGLRMFTIRLPDAEALRRVVKRLQGANRPIEAAVDHGVSQAVYVRDPDGIGVALAIDVGHAAPTWTEDPLDLAAWGEHP